MAKLPIATIVEPSGEMSIRWIRVGPPFWLPANAKLTCGSTAPVSALSAAKSTTFVVPILLNWPPRYSVLPSIDMSITRLPLVTLALKPGTF